MLHIEKETLKPKGAATHLAPSKRSLIIVAVGFTQESTRVNWNQDNWRDIDLKTVWGLKAYWGGKIGDRMTTE